MSTIADLWALQTTDLAIEAIRTRLAGLEKQKGESPKLLAARQALAEAEQARFQLAGEKRQAALDGQMRELSDRIRTAERGLMSGRVKNPKELEGMGANVAPSNACVAASATKTWRRCWRSSACRQKLTLVALRL